MSSMEGSMVEGVVSLANWGLCIVKYGDGEILYGSCKEALLKENMAISASRSSPAER